MVARCVEGFQSPPIVRGSRLASCRTFATEDDSAVAATATATAATGKIWNAKEVYQESNRTPKLLITTTTVIPPLQSMNLHDGPPRTTQPSSVEDVTLSRFQPQEIETEHDIGPRIMFSPVDSGRDPLHVQYNILSLCIVVPSRYHISIRILEEYARSVLPFAP